MEHMMPCTLVEGVEEVVEVEGEVGHT